MRALLLAAAVCWGACYDPAIPRCAVTACSTENRCPGDLECRDGYCMSEDDSEACPKLHSLKIEMGGRGKGVVAGPAGLLCPGQQCTVDVVGGAHTLTPLPGVDSRLAEWTLDGAPLPDCAPDQPCTVFLESDMTIRATFNAAKKVEVRFFGDGGGRVRSADGLLDCQSGEMQCIARFDVGAEVELVEVPDATGANPARLVRWGGDCEGAVAPDSCKLDTETDRVVDVHYDVHRVMLFPVPMDGGTIRHIAPTKTTTCPGDCELQLPPSLTNVSLIASPGVDRVVGRWINVCDSLFPVPTTCNGTIDRDMFVVVLFDEMPRLELVPNAAVNLLVKPGDLACNNTSSGTCAFHFAPDTLISITATPKMGQLDPLFEWNTCPNPADERSNRCNFQIRAAETITLNPGVVSP
jgi:hypothetical protein